MTAEELFEQRFSNKKMDTQSQPVYIIYGWRTECNEHSAVRVIANSYHTSYDEAEEERGTFVEAFPSIEWKIGTHYKLLREVED